MSGFAEEFEKALRKAVREEVKEGVREFISMFTASKEPVLQTEGDAKFALEILKDKAGVDSLQTLYKWSHEGRVPCTKRGKKLWFNRVELESWIEDGMPHSGQMKAANRLSNLVG